jgi:hypothetical protein
MVKDFAYYLRTNFDNQQAQCSVFIVAAQDRRTKYAMWSEWNGHILLETKSLFV